MEVVAVAVVVVAAAVVVVVGGGGGGSGSVRIDGYHDGDCYCSLASTDQLLKLRILLHISVGLLGRGTGASQGVYCTRQNNTDKYRHIYMRRAGCEPKIPVFEQSKSYAP